MRNKLRRFSQWCFAVAIIIAAAATTTLVAREWATGEETPPANLTPAPPEPEGAHPLTCPEPGPADAVAPAGVLTMDVAGRAIPLPAGALTESIPASDKVSWTLHSISLGNSFIVFDEQGVIGQDGVAPGDCKVFAPTVAALNALAATIPPPPLILDGVSIPIPKGGHFAGPATGGGWGPEGPTYGIYSGASFVLFNKKGPIQSNVSSADAPNFKPTLDALSKLTAKASE